MIGLRRAPPRRWRGKLMKTIMIIIICSLGSVRGSAATVLTGTYNQGSWKYRRLEYYRDEFSPRVLGPRLHAFRMPNSVRNPFCGRLVLVYWKPDSRSRVRERVDGVFHIGLRSKLNYVYAHIYRLRMSPNTKYRYIVDWAKTNSSTRF